MRKKWISIAAAVLLVLEAVFLIAQRIIPAQLSDLMPENFNPEHGSVIYFEWHDNEDLTEEELQTLWGLLEGLEYRYGGKVPGGVMKGALYHLVLTDPELPEQVNLFVTTQLGVVYLNDREYEMVGDTELLLDFLERQK